MSSPTATCAEASRCSTRSQPVGRAAPSSSVGTGVKPVPTLLLTVSFTGTIALVTLVLSSLEATMIGFSGCCGMAGSNTMATAPFAFWPVSELIV